MTDDETKTDLERARARLSVLAATMVQKFGPIDAAGSLIGAAVGVLMDAYGREMATAYLREIANETEGDGDGGPAGHA